MCGRNLSIKYPTIVLSQCYTAVLLYDPIRLDDRQRDVHSRSPTTTTDWLLAIGAFYRNPPRGGGSRGHRVRSHLAFYRLFLKVDFSHWNEWEISTFPEISTFSAELTGAKALKLYIQIPKVWASFQCFPLVSHLNFWRFFAKYIIFLLLPKESFPHIFNAKIQFQVWFGCPKPKFALQIGGNQKQFWRNFWRGMEDLQKVFRPWKYGKDPTKSGGDIGGPKWGSKFLITPAISPTGKTLEAENGKCRFRHVDFHPILQAGVETDGTFYLC